MGWRKFCGWLLRTLGWTAVEPLPEEKKCIILGAPHTTVWDFFISYLYFKSIGGDGLCMVKKEMFFPPLGWILRAMGGLPVDRGNSGALVRSLITEMKTRDTFYLAIAPEGTRKPVRRWKSGYHLIAREAGVEFITVDRAPFMERSQPVYDTFPAELRELAKRIQEVK